MTLGLALLSWVALIAPVPARRGADAVGGSWSRSPTRSATSCCWPPAIRLAVDTGTRQPGLLPAALEHRRAAGHRLRLRPGDRCTAPTRTRSWLDVGWIGFYLLWGAAALHPSMRELEQPAPDRERAAHAAAPGAADRRLADRAGDGADCRSSRHGDIDLLVVIGAVGRAVRPRGGRAWPGSSASRSARSRASACSARRAPRWWPPPVARRSTRLRWMPSARCSAEAPRRGCACARTTAQRVAAGTRSPSARWPIGAGTADELLAEPAARSPLRATLREDLRLRPSTPTPHVLAPHVRGEARGLLVVAGARATSRAAAQRAAARCAHSPRRSRSRSRARR